MAKHDVAEILEHALNLTANERASVAERLLASLDELDPAEAERLWAEEATRRLEGFRNGTARAIPAATVHARAEKLLRE